MENSSQSQPPKGKGRKKLEMKKMEKESNLQVTFSKRRSGLFKKASELCLLCGVEIAVIVFSPKEKVFSFGHPSVEVIVDRYLRENPSPSSTTFQLLKAHRNANIYDLNRQLTDLLNQLKVEKRKSEVLSKMRKTSQYHNLWWEAPVENLGLEQLQLLKVAVKTLKENIAEMTKRHLAKAAIPIATGTISDFVGGDGESSSAHGLTLTPNGLVLR